MKTDRADYLPEWKPGQEILITIADLKGEKRSVEEINEMMDIIACAAANQGFELANWGLRPSFEKNISKRLVRRKIKEAVDARDLQLYQKDPDRFGLLATAEKPPYPEVDYIDASDSESR